MGQGLCYAMLKKQIKLVSFMLILKKVANISFSIYLDFFIYYMFLVQKVYLTEGAVTVLPPNMLNVSLLMCCRTVNIYSSHVPESKLLITILLLCARRYEAYPRD